MFGRLHASAMPSAPVPAPSSRTLIRRDRGPAVPSASDEDVASDDACRASMIGATADASALTAGVHTTPASFRDSGSTARLCSIPRIVTSSCVLFDMARCRECVEH